MRVPVRPAAEPPTLVDLVTRRALESAGTGFLWLRDGEDEGPRLDFRALDLQARGLAARLQAVCAPGSRALLAYPAGPEYVAGFFGCLYAGLIAVPAYAPRSRRDWPRLEAILADCRPAVVLTTDGEAAAVRELLAARPEPVALLMTGADVAAAAAAWREVRPGPDDVAYLQYTSGSTSSPRGVIVSQANALANLALITRSAGFDGDSVTASWLPLFHDMGLVYGVLMPVYLGLTAVMFSPAAFVQRPLRWLRAISRYGVTHSGGPNFAYDLCARRAEPAQLAGLDLRRWRLAFNGAEPVHHGTLERFAAAFRPCGFSASALYPVYGLAEATLMVTGPRPGSGARSVALDPRALAAGRVAEPASGEGRRLVSCGAPGAGHRVVIADPEGARPCADGAVGEIWIAGPSVARGYWGRPEASSSCFGARLAGSQDGLFLRTGDLGFLRDGELFVTGRLKDCIILRGENHYPQDIERSVEAAHPGVVAAAAFAVDGDERERLVVLIEARATSPLEAIADAAVRAVAEDHDLPLDTAVVVRRGSLPRTSSGKIQRGRCRSLHLEGGLEPLAVRRRPAASGPLPLDEAAAGGAAASVEDWLRARCARLLGVEARQIDPEAPLASLGLDSLAAIELVHAAQTALGLTGGAGAPALAGASLRSVAASLAARDERDPAPAASPGRHPLTSSQRALWTLHRLAPDNPTLNIARCVRIPAGLDLARLRGALAAVVRRHPALRTSFETTPDGPLQVVHSRGRVELAVLDRPGWSDDALRACMADAAAEPFDLEAGPLMRARVFRRSSGDAFLLLVLHHLVCDFWSLGLLWRELAEPGSGAAGIGIGIGAEAEREAQLLASTEGQEAWRYWREVLTHELPRLPLGHGGGDPGTGPRRAGLRPFRIEAEAAAALRRFARERGTTAFTALLAVLEALLAGSLGQDRFLIGIPTHGRRHACLEDEIGYFVAPVAVEADVSGDPSFEALHARVERGVAAALRHAALPFAAAVERLAAERIPPPRFQVLFASLRAHPRHDPALSALALGLPEGRVRLGGLEAEPFPLPSRYTQLELTVNAAEVGDAIAGSFEYDLAVLTPDAVDGLAERFVQLVEELPASRCRLSDVPVVSADERHRQLEVWNRTARPYDLGPSLHARIDAAAARWPERIALQAGERTLTYADLVAAKDRLARRLREAGVGPEAVAGVCVERSPEMILGALSVLAAGGAYLALDPQAPRERTRQMLRQSRCRLVLCDPAQAGAFEDLEVQPLPLDPGLASRGDERAAALPDVVGPDHAAYVLFTSGSTGAPKGAVNTHGGICNRLLWMQERYGLSAEDAVLFKAPFTFDVSLWEMFWPLLAGARVVVAPPGAQREPARLARLIADEGVTTAHFVPSMLRLFLAEPEAAACSSLRRVVVSGEELSADLRDRFFERLPGAELHNLYGPTEAAVDVSAWACGAQDGAGSVPIGRPIANARLYVTDAHLRLRPAGRAGELCIAGVCLGRGYAGRPDLTAAAFVPDPFSPTPGGRMYRTGDLARWRPDGTIEFLGRLDGQVKVGGVRIELGEVEASLRAHPAVEDCAVIAQTTAPWTKALAAYFVPRSVVTPAELRAWLRERLPREMVPSAFVALAALPVNGNGKLDRKALPAPEAPSAAAEGAPPRTPLERELAEIWREVLCLEVGSASDSFLDLGGHSLLAIRLLLKIRERFDVELPLEPLLRGTETVASQALSLEARVLARTGRDEIEAALRRLENH